MPWKLWTFLQRGEPARRFYSVFISLASAQESTGRGAQLLVCLFVCLVLLWDMRGNYGKQWTNETPGGIMGDGRG